MLRWLTAVFFVLTLIGCAAEQSGNAARSPAVFHGGGGAAAQVMSEPQGGYELADDAVHAEEVDSTKAKNDSTPAKAVIGMQPAPPPPPAPVNAHLPTGPSFVTQSPHAADLIIYTATITMAVYQVEPGLDAVEKIAREVGGYLAQRHDTEITIRVPRDRFDDALRRVQLTGDVIHRDVNAQDVTDQYVELETRLRNARAMRDRLEQLLARAAVKEAVEIEKELGRVTGEIEAMEGKLKVLRDKIAYSTITVAFSPRGASAVRDVPLRLPFGWLGGLGLPRLLSLGEGQ